MGIKFANNASTNITHALTADATSVSVTPGTGDLFPSIVEGKDYFYATLAGNNGLEIVKVTKRVLDTMNVERAQDGTSALIFNQGDLFELRIVAADFEDTFSRVETTLEDTVSHVETALEDAVDALNTSVDNKMSSYLPLSGGTMTGRLTLRPGGGGAANVPVDNDYLLLFGGTEYHKGGYVIIFGKDQPDYPGQVWIVPDNGADSSTTRFNPDGQIITKSGEVLTSAGGTFNGIIKSSTAGGAISSDADNKDITVFGGSTWKHGGYIKVVGKDATTNAGCIELVADTGTTATSILVKPDGNATINGSTILTSIGGVVNHLYLPVGAISSITSEGAQELVLEGGTTGTSVGALLILRDLRRTGWPSIEGSAALVTRNADGTIGPSLDMYNNGEAWWSGGRVLTTADSATLARYAMPSSRFFDLTMGASGTTYTAPENGYYVLDISTTSTNAQIWAEGNYWFDGRSSTGGNIQWTSPACKKGDTMTLHFVSVNTAVASLRFVYAEGDK